MKDTLIAIRKISATSDCNREVFANLTRLVQIAGNKPGCTFSQLYATLNQANEWIVIEGWRNEEALSRHETSPEKADLDSLIKSKASVSCVVAVTIEPTNAQPAVYEPHFWIGDRLP